MGLFDRLLGVIGGGHDERPCPNCGGALDPEGLVDGLLWCDGCGRLYRDESGGLLTHLQRGWSSPSGRTCEQCGASLDSGDHYLPYEDGSNPDAYIICRDCRHRNILYGFGGD